MKNERFEMLTYNGIQNIDADDILTAVNISKNHEADLIVDGRLFLSWMAMSSLDILKELKKVGIIDVSSPHSNSYCLAYADRSLNRQMVFADFYLYEWKGIEHLEVKCHTYKAYSTCQKFESMDEVYCKIRKDYLSKIGIENIHIQTYFDGCNIIDPSAVLNKVMI